MTNPINNYWQLKLEAVKQRLEANKFDVYLADSAEKAKEIALGTIIPPLKAKSVSWGGSVSFVSTGLFEALKDSPDFEVMDTFDTSLPAEQKFELRRRSLMADLFITGTNAVTEDGQLVNLDMIGNRVAAIMWGPRHVLLIVGRNKICRDIKGAMARIKNYAAPVNCMKLDKKTPCAKAGVCHDCSSPDRICNYWTITEKSFEQGRIKIILVNEDLGF
ncbi:MAG: lactate utilization protein [Desulfobacterales bacterium]|nr:lactate utilization protein [Desulfobacterales bacterium]